MQKAGDECEFEPDPYKNGRRMIARITENGFSLSTVRDKCEKNRQQAEKTGIYKKPVGMKSCRGIYIEVTHNLYSQKTDAVEKGSLTI